MSRSYVSMLEEVEKCLRKAQLRYVKKDILNSSPSRDTSCSGTLHLSHSQPIVAYLRFVLPKPEVSPGSSTQQVSAISVQTWENLDANGVQWCEKSQSSCQIAILEAWRSWLTCHAGFGLRGNRELGKVLESWLRHLAR